MSDEYTLAYDLLSVGETPREIKAKATSEQCSALAKRFGVLEIGRFCSELRLSPSADGIVLTGQITAEIKQACSITAQPVSDVVRTDLNILFLNEKDAPADRENLEEIYDVDDVELITSNEVNLGELCAQYLGLEINPYPRAPGATLDDILPQEKPNPFAVLAQLKDKT